MKKQYTSVIFSLLDTPAFGGAEQFMFSHLQFLNQQGYSIVLATNNPVVKKEILSRLSAKQKKTFHLIDAPYRLDAIGNWKGLLKFFLSLPKALIWCSQTLKRLTTSYEKVMCLWPGFSDRLVFSPLARIYHCPLVWIEIGPLDPTFKKNFGFPRLLYRFAEKYPQQMITISLFSKKSILRNTHFTKKEISLIYPGTKLFSKEEIKTYQKQGKEFKKQKKLRKKMVISVVARLAHENEIDMVIRGFYLYLKKSKKKDIQLLIMGDGPERKQLEELTQKLSLTGNVTFSGFITEEQKRIRLAASHFFIFPRAWELDGFGMTTIEAMSLELPVLTTDFGPQIEIVQNGKEGYKYKPHDSKDLSRKIETMVTISPQLRNAMKKNAYKRVQYFSDTNAHNNMLHVIQSIQ